MIIARRAALELRAHHIENLGVGIPEGVAAVAEDEGVLDLITLTTEPGVDLECDILAHMDFSLAISPALKTMDERIFQSGSMQLREHLWAHKARRPNEPTEEPKDEH